MKSINITFEDTEFNKLKTAKGDMSWHDFIMTMLDITLKYQRQMTGEIYVGDR